MILPSGVGCIDNLLNGGIKTGRITQVYGEAAAGKTTLGLVYINAIYNMGYNVLLINPEANSPIERLEQITGKQFKFLSKSVEILVPKTFYEQAIIIEDLEMLIQQNTRLIVIDTLTRLYRASLEAKDRNYEAHRELNRQTGILKGIARHLDLAVLVLNQVRAQMGNTLHEFEPVAKNIMEYWSDVTLKMKIGTQKGERIIEKLGSVSKKCHLFLTDQGFGTSDAI